MGLSEEFIVEKLKQYKKTDAGKKKVFEFRNKNYLNGKSDAPGSYTKVRLKAILKEIKTAFIESVCREIQSFRGDKTITVMSKMGRDSVVHASISVEKDALRRESLHYMKMDGSSLIPHVGRGEGLNDILALFSNGYKPIEKRAYGFWVHSKGGEYGLDRIAAKRERDPNPFLRNLTDEMNSRFKGECKVTLNDKYKKRR